MKTSRVTFTRCSSDRAKFTVFFPGAMLTSQGLHPIFVLTKIKTKIGQSPSLVSVNPDKHYDSRHRVDGKMADKIVQAAKRWIFTKGDPEIRAAWEEYFGDQMKEIVTHKRLRSSVTAKCI